jgi:hypothetical protein
MNDATATGTPAANTANPYYAAPPARREWGFAPGDAVFAAFAFLLGLLFWDWIVFVPSPGRRRSHRDVDLSTVPCSHLWALLTSNKKFLLPTICILQHN